MGPMEKTTIETPPPCHLDDCPACRKPVDISQGCWIRFSPHGQILSVMHPDCYDQTHPVRS